MRTRECRWYSSKQEHCTLYNKPVTIGCDSDCAYCEADKNEFYDKCCQLEHQNAKMVEALESMKEEFNTAAYREDVVYKLVKDMVIKALAEVKGE